MTVTDHCAHVAGRQTSSDGESEGRSEGGSKGVKDIKEMYRSMVGRKRASQPVSQSVSQ